MGKYRVGKSLSWDENFCVELEKMKEAGFEAVDFDLCKFRHDREKELENYKNMEDGLDAIKRSGLFFNGVHVSFGNEWDISALDELPSSTCGKMCVCMSKYSLICSPFS